MLCAMLCVHVQFGQELWEEVLQFVRPYNCRHSNLWAVDSPAVRSGDRDRARGDWAVSLFVTALVRTFMILMKLHEIVLSL